MDVFAIVLVIAVLGFVIWTLVRSRRRQAQRMGEAPKTAAGAGLATGRDLFAADARHRVPVADFHVHGEEARVYFDVPLPEEEDEVLNGLLVDEAVEVVREKRHTLPIDDVTEIVVYAGRGEPRVIGRTKLHSPGELPPPMGEMGLSFSHIAHDPFAAPFEEGTDHSVMYETRMDVPADELGPIVDELKLPEGLIRGLRAIGVDPAEVSAEDLVLALLRMFGYGVTEQAMSGSYMAIKDGLSTYILTERHQRGDHPELDDSVIKRFIGEFNSSGADRGILLTGKYAPFSVNEIEARQPNVRFVTRERIQHFIDLMALG